MTCPLYFERNICQYIKSSETFLLTNRRDEITTAASTLLVSWRRVGSGTIFEGVEGHVKDGSQELVGEPVRRWQIKNNFVPLGYI